jgi:hypothetical protein
VFCVFVSVLLLHKQGHLSAFYLCCLHNVLDTYIHNSPAAVQARSTMPIRVVVADRPPVLSIDRTAGGDSIYSGMLWELLPTLLEQAKINDTFTVFDHNVR